MIHPDTYVKLTPKGLSLFAKRSFKKGEILWIVDDFDLKIGLPDYQKIQELQRKTLDRFSYLDYKSRVIIPWDEGKYVNHSCAPNSTGLLEFDNISVALRSIRKDEEIVEDYYCYFGHFEEFRCLCGAPNCRGMVREQNTYDEGLRLSLKDVASIIFSQPQPLLQVQSEENNEFFEILATYGYRPAGSPQLQSSSNGTGAG